MQDSRMQRVAGKAMQCKAMQCKAITAAKGCVVLCHAIAWQSHALPHPGKLRVSLLAAPPTNTPTIHPPIHPWSSDTPARRHRSSTCFCVRSLTFIHTPSHCYCHCQTGFSERNNFDVLCRRDHNGCKEHPTH
eukprot:355120-Chlamydomonas_euryale.AAC.3